MNGGQHLKSLASSSMAISSDGWIAYHFAQLDVFLVSLSMFTASQRVQDLRVLDVVLFHCPACTCFCLTQS